MGRDRRARLTRALGATVAAGFLALGAGELVTRLDHPLPLLFWLPTLWGGAALILLGFFHPAARGHRSTALVVLGALLGLIPSVWTVLMPVLVLALVVLTITGRGRPVPEPAS